MAAATCRRSVLQYIGINSWCSEHARLWPRPALLPLPRTSAPLGVVASRASTITTDSMTSGGTSGSPIM